MTILFLVLAGSYLTGAIPFSYIAGKLLKGIDLRDHGSGNLGASNTFRNLGAAAGAAVLILDVAKGYFPVFVAVRLADVSGVPVHWLALSAAFASIMGHMFSIYMKFYGGKGIATSAGAFLAIAPFAMLASLAVFLIVFAAKRIVSLASLGAAVTLPFFVFLSDRLDLSPGHWSYIAVTVALVIVIVYKHRSNIRRLAGGSEPVLARKK